MDKMKGEKVRWRRRKWGERLVVDLTASLSPTHRDTWRTQEQEDARVESPSGIEAFSI
jgi:hypothetical protein